MQYTIENNTLILSEKPQKLECGLKVLLTRNGDERKRVDYPVAITDVNGRAYDISDIVDLVNVIGVEIKQPTFLWWRKKWQVVEPVDNFHKTK